MFLFGTCLGLTASLGHMHLSLGHSFTLPCLPPPTRPCPSSSPQVSSAALEALRALVRTCPRALDTASLERLMPPIFQVCVCMCAVGEGGDRGPRVLDTASLERLMLPIFQVCVL